MDLPSPASPSFRGPARPRTNFVYVSYLRVSTQRQGQSGLGIEAQRDAVQQYVTSVGGNLLEEHIEVESGSKSQRPVLVQSIARARKAGAVLVIAKLDRLARNVAFVSSLMEAGVEFIAVDAPYATRFFVHVMAAVAEHERTMISERTKAALGAAKARGVRLGMNGGRLAALHKAEAAIFSEDLRPIFLQLTKNGAQTLAQIANKLNEQGFRTREGALWSPTPVQRVMNRLGLRTAAMASCAKPRAEVGSAAVVNR
jgi:DNA invertase Pin-like site-specific DNA recombinase